MFSNCRDRSFYEKAQREVSANSGFLTACPSSDHFMLAILWTQGLPAHLVRQISLDGKKLGESGLRFNRRNSTDGGEGRHPHISGVCRLPRISWTLTGRKSLNHRAGTCFCGAQVIGAL